jgi:hypothetical protein
MIKQPQAIECEIVSGSIFNGYYARTENGHGIFIFEDSPNPFYFRNKERLFIRREPFLGFFYKDFLESGGTKKHIYVAWL